MSNAPKVLPGSNDQEKLEALSQKTHKEQAVWFLNSFWEQFAKDQAEEIWKYAHKYADLDLEKKDQGTGLDELNAHRFLEAFQVTMTVQELRNKLREAGALSATTKFRLVPISHFLLIKFSCDYHTLVNASQGDNAKEIAEAERRLDEVSVAMAEADLKSKEASAALKEAKAKETEAAARETSARETEATALAREEEARSQEAPFKAAQEEVDSALADVRSQESQRDNKTADLKRKSEEGGVVQQNRAKNELAQHLAADPLPLSKAKITLEAAYKKAEKARAPFEASTKQAEAARALASEAADQASAARAAASASKQASEDAKAAADQALEAAIQSVADAEAYLQEIRSQPGCAFGALWWMDRELFEKKKYLPERKGGIKRD
eukprot:TRINITY_DN192_c0_g1_i1.p1 TRINITY_DN192_c0_g1~~TRINITY_DN192_c0_g1_i1.p1  ORF type:complete len:394 (-),score=253.38 TRINITY_DN192_c0_g1_i1:93-1238(-)